MATKRLASDCGLVQKTGEKQSKGPAKNITEQEFTHVFVLDFESTCWENRKGFWWEIIEFPVVLLHLASGEILAEFQEYIKPSEHPVLSDFCTNLTGITQDQVDGGINIRACMNKFTQWVIDTCEEYQISFNGRGIPLTIRKHKAIFITWTDWDLGCCLHNELERKKIHKPWFFTRWTDIKHVYKTFYERYPKGLAGALNDLGMAFEGREHSGICDARNTARLVARMVNDGCVIPTTFAPVARFTRTK